MAYADGVGSVLTDDVSEKIVLMTEKEKMLAGKLYDANYDPQLLAERYQKCVFNLQAGYKHTSYFCIAPSVRSGLAH